jgi:hypothetical protein
MSVDLQRTTGRYIPEDSTLQLKEAYEHGNGPSGSLEEENFLTD